MNVSSKPAIKKHASLKPVNTLHIDATADYWTEIGSPDDLLKVMDTDIFNHHAHFILGGGSNVLFAKDFHGLIIKNSLPGITLISEDNRHAIIEVGAGVVWDDLVNYSLQQGWGGLENLSMIPGLTGAAPIQNIGAYGVELESVFVSLEAIHLKTGRKEKFDKSMCRFGYRESIFKTTKKGAYIITSITLALSKQPELHLDYGNLRKELTAEGIVNPSIRDVSRAVRRIRSSKLPDPSEIGNAGSFFKNPVIPKDQFRQMQEIHPDIPGFQLADDRVKVPAAWLIERCGFKGKRMGDAGVHERHALILVNYGNATGQELLELARTIQEEVRGQFGIQLEPEVNIV